MGLDKTVGVLEKISFSVTRFINAIGVFFLAVMMIIITLVACCLLSEAHEIDENEQ